MKTAIYPTPGIHTFKKLLPQPDRIMRYSCISYLGLFIFLPLFAILLRSLEAGPVVLLEKLFQPEALTALQLTLLLTGIMTVINSIMGLITAWVLVRYSFPMKSVLNSLIDLPFAIPTVVTGLMLVVLYGPAGFLGGRLSSCGIEIIYAKLGIVLALMFVTFPFTVRAVQPVLMALDEQMEEAARSLGASDFRIFKDIIIPDIAPAVINGAAQAFSRGLGEFGAVIIVAGNIPLKTQMASVYIYGEIESYSPESALSVSLILLMLSFVSMFVINRIQAHRAFHEIF